MAYGSNRRGNEPKRPEYFLDNEIYDDSAVGFISFGQASNGWVCSTGKHHGTGIWTPSQRAAVYKRAIVRGWGRNFGQWSEYLRSYEADHGVVPFRDGDPYDFFSNLKGEMIEIMPIVHAKSARKLGVVG